MDRYSAKMKIRRFACKCKGIFQKERGEDTGCTATQFFNETRGETTNYSEYTVTQLLVKQEVKH